MTPSVRCSLMLSGSLALTCATASGCTCGQRAPAPAATGTPTTTASAIVSDAPGGSPDGFLRAAVEVSEAPVPPR